MPNPTLTEQREAVEALINLGIDNGVRDWIIERAKNAVLTMAWFERREELAREIDRLERQAPELAAVLRRWPGLQIAGVR